MRATYVCAGCQRRTQLLGEIASRPPRGWQQVGQRIGAPSLLCGVCARALRESDRRGAPVSCDACGASCPQGLDRAPSCPSCGLVPGSFQDEAPAPPEAPPSAPRKRQPPREPLELPAPALVMFCGPLVYAPDDPQSLVSALALAAGRALPAGQPDDLLLALTYQGKVYTARPDPSQRGNL